MDRTPFDVEPSDIPGLLFITMTQIGDDRGVVRELYRRSAFAGAGISEVGPWVQVNATETRQGAIRGLHGERTHKLVAVVHGEAFGAYVDARPDSPTRGAVVTTELRPGSQVLVPPGVCNGFQSVSPGVTQYLYCFDEEWRPDMPGVAVHPLDDQLGIPWPLAIDPDDPAMLSAKDRSLPPLEALAGSLR